MGPPFFYAPLVERSGAFEITIEPRLDIILHVRRTIHVERGQCFAVTLGHPDGEGGCDAPFPAVRQTVTNQNFRMLRLRAYQDFLFSLQLRLQRQ